MLHIDLFSKAQMDEAYQKSLLISAQKGLTKAQTIGYLQMCINTLQDKGPMAEFEQQIRTLQARNQRLLNTNNSLRAQLQPTRPKRWNPRTPKTLRNIIKWYSGRLYRWSLKKNV